MAVVALAGPVLLGGIVLLAAGRTPGVNFSKFNRQQRWSELRVKQ